MKKFKLFKTLSEVEDYINSSTEKDNIIEMWHNVCKVIKKNNWIDLSTRNDFDICLDLKNKKMLTLDDNAHIVTLNDDEIQDILFDIK